MSSDPRFNSFQDPWNGVNANQAAGQDQWGVNSAYLTPPYLSPYRPQYQGSNGDPGSGWKPGFWTSANYLFNPFRPGGDNYGGNVYKQQAPAYTSITSTPSDGSMGIAQQYAAPGLATWAAYKYLGNASTAAGRNLGIGFGSGLSRGMGLSTRAAGTMGYMAGGVGGLAGGILGPMLPAAAASWGADKLMFDPYLAQRKMSNSMYSNFSGISYGEGVGNSIDDRGLSRRTSSSIARGLNVAGARDITFSQAEYGQISDLAGRSGMLDGVSGKNLDHTLKNVIKSVKSVMAIANTSDFKESIELMAQLSRQGVKIQDISSTLSKFGGFASAAGISTQKFLSTTGAQGGYMAQSAGLTPFAGMMVAGQSQSVLAAGYRSGLISYAAMARMGGVEGATQSSSAGVMTAMSSPYAMMTGMNALSKHGTGTSVYGNISTFGGQMARDPLETMGSMDLNGPAITSNLMKDGLNNTKDQMMQFARLNPYARAQINSGTGLKAGTANWLLQKSMGLDRSSSLAILEALKAGADPESHKAAMAGMRANDQDQFYKFMQQNNRDMGKLSMPYHAVTNIGRSMQAWTSDNPYMENLSGMSDKLQSAITEARFGKDDSFTEEMYDAYKEKRKIKSFKAKSGGVDGIHSRFAIQDKFKVFSTSDAAQKISDASKRGMKAADVLLDSKSSEAEKLRAVEHLVSRNVLNKSTYSSADDAKRLVENLGNHFTVEEGSQNVPLMEYHKVTRGSVTDSVRYLAAMGEASDLLSRGVDSFSSKEDQDKLTKVANVLSEYHKGIDFKKMENLREKVQANTERATRYGLMGDMTLGLDAVDPISKVIKEKGVNAAARQYISPSSTIVTEQEFWMEYKRKNGTTIKTRTYNSDDIDHTEVMKFHKNLEANAKERLKLDKLLKSGKMDFSDWVQKTTSLDMRDSISMFDQAVRTFVGGVETKTGNKVPLVNTSPAKQESSRPSLPQEIVNNGINLVAYAIGNTFNQQ